MPIRSSDIYTRLAPLYDVLMSDVDYESWADYIDECIQNHNAAAVDVLELASGTGSLILSLAELECYTLRGSDGSAQMVEIAAEKAKNTGYAVPFTVIDFKDFQYEGTQDVIFTVFDSINYLQDASEITELLEKTHRHLKPGGLFIFDFSTPRNSLEAVDFLNDEEGDLGWLRYYRTSTYDPESGIHTNRFEIEELDEATGTVINTFEEVHKQKAYSLNQMLSIVQESPYHLLASYDGFDMIPAHENSTRVTMILQCQKQL